MVEGMDAGPDHALVLGLAQRPAKTPHSSQSSQTQEQNEGVPHDAQKRSEGHMQSHLRRWQRHWAP